MVREGEKPRRELAACCKVEVMNGARGERLDAFLGIDDSREVFDEQVGGHVQYAGPGLHGFSNLNF
jgi:hypothetical protein